MIDSQEGMAQGHFGTRVTHHFADVFPHGRLVAVNRAVGAHRLFIAPGTLSESGQGVVDECRAGLAEAIVIRRMVILAVDFEHGSNGLFFPLATHDATCLSVEFQTIQRDPGRNA